MPGPLGIEGKKKSPGPGDPLRAIGAESRLPFSGDSRRAEISPLPKSRAFFFCLQFPVVPSIHSGTFNSQWYLQFPVVPTSNSQWYLQSTVVPSVHSAVPRHPHFPELIIPQTDRCKERCSDRIPQSPSFLSSFRALLLRTVGFGDNQFRAVPRHPRFPGLIIPQTDRCKERCSDRIPQSPSLLSSFRALLLRTVGFGDNQFRTVPRHPHFPELIIPQTDRCKERCSDRIPQSPSFLSSFRAHFLTTASFADNECSPGPGRGATCLAILLVIAKNAWTTGN